MLTPCQARWLCPRPRAALKQSPAAQMPTTWLPDYFSPASRLGMWRTPSASRQTAGTCSTCFLAQHIDGSSTPPSVPCRSDCWSAAIAAGCSRVACLFVQRVKGLANRQRAVQQHHLARLGDELVHGVRRQELPHLPPRVVWVVGLRVVRTGTLCPQPAWRKTLM